MTLTTEELKYGAEVGDLGIEAVRAVCAEALANREVRPVYQYRMRNPYNDQVTDWKTIKPEQVDFILKETIAANVEFRIIAAPPAPAVPDGWIACSERMPTPFVDVIASDGKQTFTAHFIDESDWWCLVSQLAEEPGDVTHWMPLPAAPEGGNG